MTASRLRSLSLRSATLASAAVLALGGLAAAEDPPAPPPAPTPAPAPPAAEPKKPEPPPLPPGVVARVKGRDVPLAEFHRHLAERLRPDLADPKSEASTTLGMKIEEMVVEQEVKRLGISVTNEDIDRRYAEIDAEVRKKSDGKQNLADLLKAQGMPEDEFRHNLRMIVLKERVAGHPSYLGDTLPKDENRRLAQVEVVIGQLLQRAKIERDGLPPGVVARVNGQPLTDEEFGAAVDLRMRTARFLTEYVAGLVLRDLPFSDEALDASLARDRAYWEKVRLRDAQPEMQTLPYEEYVKVKYGRTLEQLRKDPYFRGLRALESAVHAKVGEDDVRAEWVRSAKERYGASIQVIDVQVSFKIPSAIVEPVERRSREEAQRIVTDLARRIAAGETAAVLQELGARKTPDGRPDRSVQAVRRSVRDSGNTQLVFEQATKLADGAWSAPFETISEWHLVRRERFDAAPSFEEARDQVLQDLVVQRANSLLQDQLHDRSLVQVADKK